MNKDLYFMKEAIKLAKIAYNNEEVPVGCVIVKDDKIIGRGYNKVEEEKNSLMHAELIAIDEACKNLKTWRLTDCTIYVTLEPCAMCAGAMVYSRIKKLVYGGRDIKRGCAGSYMNLLDTTQLNHKAEVIGGVLEDECIYLMSEFFREIRLKKKNKK